MNIRGSGLLLHITSLYTRYGIGDLGPAAYDFIRFLSLSGQQYWQILPVYPTDSAYDNSPYHALSTFAGNPLLISPDLLVADGYLEADDLNGIPDFPEGEVDFKQVIEYKEKIFSQAYDRFIQIADTGAFLKFCNANSQWLNDFARFMALRKRYTPDLWGDWPEEYKRRNPDAIREFEIQYAEDIQREKFLQFLFAMQWDALRNACRHENIWLIGDIPIYVDYDSSDLWTHPELFQLGEDLKPTVISGVPPDYFSSTGQVWDNPIYNWDKMEQTGFQWWIHRIAAILSRVDYLRIDHFRGLIAYWEIPSGSMTAIQGVWSPAPAYKFLRTLGRSFSSLPIIAEDLGIITPEVREVMRQFSLSGMKVLLFAFQSGMADNPYILHNHVKECVVYTGTHDNNPILGWYESEATDLEKQNVSSYLGRPISSQNINESLIRMAMMSVANTVIIPVQDVLHLDGSSRMNQPGVNVGNWKWRLRNDQLSPEIANDLRIMTMLYGRV